MYVTIGSHLMLFEAKVLFRVSVIVRITITDIFNQLEFLLIALVIVRITLNMIVRQMPLNVR